MKSNSYTNSLNLNKPNKTIIADNLIELSNIQYLLKYVNFIQPDPQEVFYKCLDIAQDEEQTKLIQLKVKNKIDMMPYTEFDINQYDNRQPLYESTIKKEIQRSLQARIPIRPLSKQQLLHMGHIKITQQKQRSQKQIARSRRSFEYIQNLKQKISTTIKKEQPKVSKQAIMQMNQMLDMLGKLQQERYHLKMQLYQVEKEDNKQLIKINLYKMFEQNLLKARTLYNLCMSQSKISLTTKSSLLQKSQTKSLSKGYYNREIEKVSQLQKFLNSILLDERQLQLIHYSLKSI